METIRLEIDKVIGSDDIFDRLFIIPLVVSWKIPKECVYNFVEECKEPISYIYILRSPVVDDVGTKFERVGACRAHHKYLQSVDDQKEQNG